MADRILVADDELDMRSLLAFNLNRAGYAVTTARDGGEAFEKARMLLPDAIVLDVRMPGLDGLSVCRQLHELPATRDIPVVIITGNGDEGTRDESTRCGAADYLPKPFSPRELVRRVEEILDEKLAGVPH